MRSECKREKPYNQIKSKREVEPEKQEETKYQLLEINHVKYAEIGAKVKT